MRRSRVWELVTRRSTVERTVACIEVGGGVLGIGKAEGAGGERRPDAEASNCTRPTLQAHSRNTTLSHPVRSSQSFPRLSHPSPHSATLLRALFSSSTRSS